MPGGPTVGRILCSRTDVGLSSIARDVSIIVVLGSGGFKDALSDLSGSFRIFTNAVCVLSDAVTERAQTVPHRGLSIEGRGDREGMGKGRRRVEGVREAS